MYFTITVWLARLSAEQKVGTNPTHTAPRHTFETKITDIICQFASVKTDTRISAWIVNTAISRWFAVIIWGAKICTNWSPSYFRNRNICNTRSYGLLFLFLCNLFGNFFQVCISLSRRNIILRTNRSRLWCFWLLHLNLSHRDRILLSLSNRRNLGLLSLSHRNRVLLSLSNRRNWSLLSLSHRNRVLLSLINRRNWGLLSLSHRNRVLLSLSHRSRGLIYLLTSILFCDT